METLDTTYKYYKKVDDTILIEILVQNVQQIFNPLDPSPYPGKTLDKSLEEYITDAVKDFPLPSDMELVMYLPEEDLQKETASNLDQTIHNHFLYKAAQTQREMRETFASGRISLAIGISFLAITIVANLVIAKNPDTILHEIIRNSLLIIGWVAMWQPISLFLYAWWPIRKKVRVYQKISTMKISFVPLKNTKTA